MKTLRNYFLLVSLALMSLVTVSCGGNDDELDPFIQMDNAQKFINAYKSRLPQAILVDLRSPEDWAKDGLQGSYNLSVMNADGKTVNAKDLDPKLGGTWPKRLLELAGDKNVAVFLYGNTNFAYTRDIAGHASQVGFGKKNTIITLSKVADLQAAMDNQ